MLSQTVPLDMLSVVIYTANKHRAVAYKPEYSENYTWIS